MSTPDRSKLTKDQRNVLEALEKGRTAPQIAQDRHVSVNSVYGMTRKLRAMGFKTSTQARTPGQKAATTKRAAGTDKAAAAAVAAATKARRKGRQPPPVTTPNSQGAGADAVVRAAENNLAMLKKQIENLIYEADSLSVQSEAKRREAGDLTREQQAIHTMISAAETKHASGGAAKSKSSLANVLAS